MKTLLAALLFGFSLQANAYLECQYYNGAEFVSTTWTHGATFTGLPGYVLGSAQASCWATEHELLYVRANFSGIPMTGHLMVLWTGDSADFILANMPILLGQ